MIITRYLSATSAGLLITTSLLFLMQALIDIGPDVVTEPIVYDRFEWVMPKKDETLNVEDPKPVKPRPPEAVPADPRQPSSDVNWHVGVPNHLPLPGPGPIRLDKPVPADGPPISLINVAPVYPARALEKGLEGYVIVSYDVLANGAVANVVVTESSHSVFDDAAIAAAYRFRYKPRIVDGVAIETH
ncbi:MAG: TonB family protein, partial [Gammaproteobacteria bacterium]|nr:TonB family protein [Gammaproteobacteria bacterium]